MVTALGADNTIDYKKQKLEFAKKFDAVIDIVGNLSLEQIDSLKVKDGAGVVVGFTTFKNIRSIILRGKSKNTETFTIKPNSKDLDYLRVMAEKGHLKPIIEKEYSFSSLPAALKQFMKGGTKGKIVVSVTR